MGNIKSPGKDVDVSLILPPAVQLTIEHLPRVLQVIAIVKSINCSSALAAKALKESTDFKKYADFLDPSYKLTVEEFRNGFNALKAKNDFKSMIMWIRAFQNLLKELSEDDEIKKWLRKFPQNHPKFVNFTMQLADLHFDEEVQFPGTVDPPQL